MFVEFMQEDIRHRPKFTPADAVQLANELYGIDARADPLPSERDQNFELRSASGDRFVLKIANSGASRDILECQNQAMQRIAIRSSNVACPIVYPPDAEKQIREVSGPGHARHFVRLVTWVPGVPLAKIQPHSPKLLRSLGDMLGQVTKALDGFSHPAAEREFPWDLARARDVVHTLAPAIRDSSRRDLVAHSVSAHEKLVAAKRLDLRKSVLHNDANDYNVLVDQRPSLHRRVSGLIDFGDMVYSHTVYELAVCLAYAMLGTSDPLSAAAQVVTGYHNMFPLTETEIEVLFPLACMRLCTSVSMSANQRQLAPDNEYLSISEEPAWALLRRLHTLQPSVARDVFWKACQMGPSAELSNDASSPAETEMSAAELVAKRKLLLGKSLSLSYRHPLKIVRGGGQYLYDANGREYLDCVNNVCHVGHCHPHVVAAATRQMATLNTNTRYLHQTIVRYAERLTAMLPDTLSVCFFVNSGSEANDLALRLARSYTSGTEMVVVQGAYHGNLSSLIDISPYKFAGPGGQGSPEFVHTTMTPDRFRGPHKYDDPDAGRKYAADVQAKLRGVEDAGRQVAAFICESLLSCGGQIVLPDGYLCEVYRRVRAAGGVCIADEVQVGFGRVGSHFWGFETQGVVPDIVTLGKPIGNGHPLGAVVTTQEIADAFANGMEYFNTYGGNPVSCAVGLAVLETIEREGLQAQADRVGRELKMNLQRLMAKHSVVGDVRGLGMFLGVELVDDRITLAPAAGIANRIVERAKDEGLLLSTDGPLHNVVKIKPPLTFSEENAERLVETLDKILGESPAD